MKKNRLTEEQVKLYKAIDQILWDDWDPIGMKLDEGARDEYESYVAPIFSLKIANASTEKIASKLFEFESKRMGYNDGFENCLKVAKKIKDL